MQWLNGNDSNLSSLTCFSTNFIMLHACPKEKKYKMHKELICGTRKLEWMSKMSKYHSIWWFYLNIERSEPLSCQCRQLLCCTLELIRRRISCVQKEKNIFSFPNDSNLNNINFLWQTFRLFFLFLLKDL